MDKCSKCLGEGLVHQGESIKYTCEDCKGAGTNEEIVYPNQPFVEETLEKVAE